MELLCAECSSAAVAGSASCRRRCIALYSIGAGSPIKAVESVWAEIPFGEFFPQ